MIKINLPEFSLQFEYKDLPKYRETINMADEKKSREEVGKAVKSDLTVRELQSQALKDAVWCEVNIPDKLRKSILAKFSEDEAKIAELERKLNE